MSSRSALERLRIFQFTEDGGLWASLLSCEKVLSVEEEFLFKMERKPLTAAKIKQGMLCVAERKNGMFSRAEVKDVLYSSKGPLVGLLYVDWFSEDAQPLDRLYELPESFSFSQYPALAQKFLLRGLKPVPTSDKSWGASVMSALRKLSASNSNELELMANIKDKNVDLYCGSELHQVSVSDYLLKIHLAVKFEGAAVMDNECCIVPDKEITDMGISTTKPTMQQLNMIEQLKPKQKNYFDVFVVSDSSVDTRTSLQAGGFPSTVCKELTDLGFQMPTAAQVYAWPCISAGKDVFLVAPQHSGKTLAYLLPILTALGRGSKEHVDELTAVIIVSTSWNSKSISMQAKRIFSWMPRENRLRCTAGYAGVELEASCQLLNGVNLLVCTPPSLHRLHANNTAAFSHIRYLVMDDAAALLNMFPFEMDAIFSELKLESPQTVITSRKDTPDLQRLTCKLRQNFVTIVTSPLEVAIKAGIAMIVIPTSVSDRDKALSELLHKTYIESGMQLSTDGSVAILGTSKKECVRISQYLSLNSWPVECILGVGGDEELLLTATKQKSTIIVIPDDAIDFVMKAGINIRGLVHYSIPDSKSSFCGRYGVLFYAVKCGAQCWCASLDDCTKSSPLMVEIFERVGQEVPNVLKEMAVKELENKEAQLSSHGTQLCYYLKAFGECRYLSSMVCRSSHRIISTKACIPSPPLLELPTNGIVKFKVVHVSTASRWWVSIVSHMPTIRDDNTRSNERRVLCHDSSLLIKMSIRMAEYYVLPENKHLQENLLEGSICGYRHSSGCYYRVQVLKFSEQLGFCFHHKEKARVRLIDLGRIEVVDVNQLLFLPQEFIDIPAQVIEVYLCRIKPRDNDMDWSQEANDLIVEHFLEKEVEGTIVWCCDQTLWVDVEEQEEYDGVQHKLMMVTPQKLLLKSEYADHNLHHVAMLKNSLHVRTEVQQLKVRHTFAQLLDGQEVSISAVSSPELFYVQLAEHQQQLCELHEAIDAEMGTSLTATTLPVCVGDYVIAKFPVDKRWYRGVVMSSESGMNQVFFLDYGDTEWISEDFCYELPKSLLQVPIQAIECKLNLGFSTRDWSVNVADHLWDIGQEKVLVAKVAGTTLAQHTMQETCYIIELVVKEQGRRITDMLIECDSWLHRYIYSLKTCRDVEEQLHQAQLIQIYVLHHSSPSVSEEAIHCLLEVASAATENVAVLLLRVVAGLLSFQSRLHVLRIKEECVNFILPFLAMECAELYELAVIILQMIEPLISWELVALERTVQSLVSLVKKDIPIKTQSTVLQLVWCLVCRDKRCSEVDQIEEIVAVGSKCEKLQRHVDDIVQLMKNCCRSSMYECEK